MLFGASVGSAIALNLDKINTILPNITASDETAALFVLGGLIGGIFPDIDNEKSYTAKLTVPVSTVICGISEMFGRKGKNHRGIFHDPLIYIIGLYLSLLYLPALVGVFIGCLSHIFLDIFNPAGVPFLFGITRLRLMGIQSGSKAAVVFTYISSAVVLAAGIFTCLNLRII